MIQYTMTTHLAVLRRMSGRDPSEPHRTSTPLELLFDLCFVVAVSQAAGQLHHALSAGHVADGLVGYAMVFFAIWWAWVNFTWFASAYDTDDVPYRLITLVQIAGGLVLAAGVPAAFEHDDFRVIVVGYVLMRVAMIGQWLRAARAHPDGRPAALRYALGIAVVQACWVARLALPAPWSGISFVVLVLAELAVPAWAEFGGRPTSWHPGHINERYGLFTLIVLGEAVAAASTATQSAISDSGLSGRLLVLAGGGLLLIFALWWSYFKHEVTDELRRSLWSTFLWAYGHYGIFAAVAALGAALEVATDTVTHTGRLGPLGASFAVAVPVALYLLLAGWLHSRMSRHSGGVTLALVTVGAVLVLAAAPLAVLSLPLAVLVMGVLVALLLAADLAVLRRSVG
jgi:low temperature requirement protein LtrA